jgi:hypothetical protein
MRAKPSAWWDAVIRRILSHLGPSPARHVVPSFAQTLAHPAHPVSTASRSRQISEHAASCDRVSFVIRPARAGGGARSRPPSVTVRASIHGMEGLGAHASRRGLEVIEL